MAVTSKLTLTPNVPNAISLDIVVVGDLGGSKIWIPNGTDGVQLPVVQYEEELATSPDTEGGQLIRSRAANPTGGGLVRITADTDVAFQQLLGDWQTTIETMRREALRSGVGGTITYTPPASGTVVTYEVASIGMTALPQDPIFLQARFVESEWAFTAHPYGLLPSQSIVTATSSTDPVMRIAVSDVPGSVPARGRLIATAPAGTDFEHFEWGLGFDDELPVGGELIDSDDLVTAGFAGVQATRTGAFDPDAAGSNVIRANTSDLVQAVCSTGPIAHIGRYRIKARVLPFGEDGIQAVRIAWSVGDGAQRRNAWVNVPEASDVVAAAQVFRELDLGLIDIPSAEIGTQTAEVQVEARQVQDGLQVSAIEVDYLMFIPAARVGKARRSVEPNPTTFFAWSGFTNESGVITGDTLDDGASVWQGAGDATDFSQIASAPFGTSADRSAAVNDAANVGRFATVAGNQNDITVRIDHAFLETVIGGSLKMGVLARFVDTSNWLLLYIRRTSSSFQLRLEKLIAGTGTLLLRTDDSQFFNIKDAIYSLQLSVDAVGNYEVRGQINGNEMGFGQPEGSPIGQDADLAVGGTLATGRVGMYDERQGSGIVERRYDNFFAWTPKINPVIFASQDVEIRDDAVLRANGDGSAFAPYAPYEGSHLLVPPAGREDRSATIVAKARRFDVDEQPDEVIDDQLTLALEVTPRVALLG